MDNSKYVLFSPVGNTDPINNGFDGPLLHIVRHYHPHTVVLFMSKEIAQYHHNDDRYVKAIKHVAPEISIIIEESDIESAHDFDVFMSRFSSILKQMEQEYKNSEILVNVTSGTAQMQATLCVLTAVGSVRVKPVQVSTPQERSNYGRAAYNVEKEIAENCDEYAAELQTKNRCLEPDIKNHVLVFACAQIRRFIQEYDYQAALQVARESAVMLGDKLAVMLEMAVDRILFKIDRYNEMKHVFGDACLPMQNNDYAKLVEYYLIMDVFGQKGMIADYVLRLSPLGTEIGRMFLYNKLDFNLKDYLNKRDRLEIDKLPDSIASHMRSKGYDRACFICLKETIELITVRAKELNQEEFSRAFLNKLNSMRAAEESVRNQAAHSLKTITADLVKIETGLSFASLDKQVRSALVECSNGLIKQDFFGLYQKMNELLIAETEAAL